MLEQLRWASASDLIACAENIQTTWVSSEANAFLIQLGQIGTNQNRRAVYYSEGRSTLASRGMEEAWIQAPCRYLASIRNVGHCRTTSTNQQVDMIRQDRLPHRSGVVRSK